MYEAYNELDAMAYDGFMQNWPGEVDFYSWFAKEAQARGEQVLEVACGTGRIAVGLARMGVQVTGMDLSPAMLHIAASKSRDLTNVRWIEGTMREFELGEQYGFIFIAGHSFQFMLTPEDQISCLESINRHLMPGGTLIVHLDHQDFPWLGGITKEKAGVFEPANTFPHPTTGKPTRLSLAWSYQPATQTATLKKAWDELGPSGEVIGRLEFAPMPMHCVFRFEMEHLLARTGFAVEAVYGDFLYNDLKDDSPGMVWVARKGQE